MLFRSWRPRNRACRRPSLCPRRGFPFGDRLPGDAFYGPKRSSLLRGEGAEKNRGRFLTDPSPWFFCAVSRSPAQGVKMRESMLAMLPGLAVRFGPLDRLPGVSQRGGRPRGLLAVLPAQAVLVTGISYHKGAENGRTGKCFPGVFAGQQKRTWKFFTCMSSFFKYRAVRRRGFPFSWLLTQALRAA